MTDKPTREPDGTWVARVEYKFKQLGGHPLGCPCSLCEDARAALGTPPEPFDAVAWLRRNMDPDAIRMYRTGWLDAADALEAAMKERG